MQYQKSHKSNTKKNPQHLTFHLGTIFEHLEKIPSFFYFLSTSQFWPTPTLKKKKKTVVTKT